jgi:cyclophilin family peptidyl-prolyl cis-trans isomerase
LKEVLFCPSCGEPQLISEMEKNYDGISLDEPFDEFMFYCGDCAYGEPMTTKSFILDNPQIDTEFKNKIELKIIANEV